MQEMGRKLSDLTEEVQDETTGRIQCEVLTTLPFCFSWIKKFPGQQSKIWVDNSTWYWLPCSLFKFFLKLFNQRCWRFSEGYLNNFSTELSTQIFDCCPRNFLIQEERISNVVSTSHWIRPVETFYSCEDMHFQWGFVYMCEVAYNSSMMCDMLTFVNILSLNLPEINLLPIWVSNPRV